MKVKEAILKRRTIRKFKQKNLPFNILKLLVNYARMAPSGANIQPWHFIIVDDSNLVKDVFSHTRWAGYLGSEGTPKENERPVAYIAVLIDTELEKEWAKSDVGAAIENILLAALEEGIASCWLGSLNREALKKLLKIPEKYKIDSLVALGYPLEASVSEDIKDSVKYWKDERGVLHVPKRKIEDITWRNLEGR